RKKKIKKKYEIIEVIKKEKKVKDSKSQMEHIIYKEEYQIKNINKSDQNDSFNKDDEINKNDEDNEDNEINENNENNDEINENFNLSEEDNEYYSKIGRASCRKRV